MLTKSDTNTAETSPLIVNNYELFKNSGILDQVDNMKNEIEALKHLLEDTKKIFDQSSTEELIDHVAKILLDKFIPATLTFVMENETSLSDVNIICFKNMQRVHDLIEVKDLEPYKHFFRLSPASITFKVFDYMVNRKNLTDPFLPLKPALIVPVMGFSRVYGFIVIGEKMVGGDYDPNEIEYLNLLLQFVSISIQNNINYTRAILDFKTRLYNHSFLMTRMEEELARIKRYGFEMSIVIIDVDHFKHFNDNYGHLAGDKVLIGIARILAKHIRKGDIAGRFGGEEFILILPHCTRDAAWNVTERIRKTIERTRITRGKEVISVTVSLGIRHIDNSDQLNSAILLDEADQALYYSKENGRNQTTFFDPISKKPQES